MSSLFFAFEGVDGSGKSTQVRMLHAKLHDRGLEVVTYKDPGDTYVGNELRRIVKDNSWRIEPKTELLLFTAARSELAHKIRDDLQRGKTVLCDRWVWSTLAYQCRPDSKISEDLVRHLDSEFNHGVTPDAYVFIDTPPEVAHRRLADRTAEFANDRFESRGLGFLRALRERYRDAIVGENSEIDVLEIDGNGTAEQVHARVLEKIQHSRFLD